MVNNNKTIVLFSGVEPPYSTDLFIIICRHVLCCFKTFLLCKPRKIQYTQLACIFIIACPTPIWSQEFLNGLHNTNIACLQHRSSLILLKLFEMHFIRRYAWLAISPRAVVCVLQFCLPLLHFLPVCLCHDMSRHDKCQSSNQASLWYFISSRSN